MDLDKVLCKWYVQWFAQQEILWFHHDKIIAKPYWQDKNNVFEVSKQDCGF